MGNRKRFKGDIHRFDHMAELISDEFGRDVHYIGDAAGGQGMLSRILNKKYGYTSEVIDPRGHVMKGVSSRQEYYHHSLASYYDLIVGLHLDEAIREVALSSLRVPTIFIPCCNFWSDQKLGTYELNSAIEAYLIRNHVQYKRVKIEIKAPKNIAFVTRPTTKSRNATGEFDEPVIKKLAHQM